MALDIPKIHIEITSQNVALFLKPCELLSFRAGDCTHFVLMLDMAI